MEETIAQLVGAIWGGLLQVPGAMLDFGLILLDSFYKEFGLLWTALAVVALVVFMAVGVLRWLTSRLS